MGNCCCNKQGASRRIVLLLLGLDNAGKTVTVQNLSGERTETVMPTVGFSVVKLKYSKYDVKIFDLGGRSDFRDVWHRYYVDAHGIIFVVDSSDLNRLSEAQAVLKNIVSSSKIQGKPVLVLANKQDHEQALDEIDLIDKLDLESLANENECPTFIQSCFASGSDKLDSGIKIGYNWLIQSIIGDYKHLQKRVEQDVECQQKLDEEERIEKFLRIKRINEEEALEAKIKPSNGTTNEIIVVQESNRVDVHSVSSTSTDIESIPSVDIVNDILPESTRPESATSLIRKQLELGNLKRRTSLQIMHNNKVSPMHVFGAKPKTVKSATARNSANSRKLPDRRNLRSAGDSVFIVSRDNHRVMPNNDGSGDLSMFNSLRREAPLRQFNVIKDVLPPINDIHSHSTHNGTYF